MHALEIWFAWILSFYKFPYKFLYVAGLLFFLVAKVIITTSAQCFLMAQTRLLKAISWYETLDSRAHVEFGHVNMSAGCCRVTFLPVIYTKRQEWLRGGRRNLLSNKDNFLNPLFTLKLCARTHTHRNISTHMDTLIFQFFYAIFSHGCL